MRLEKRLRRVYLPTLTLRFPPLHGLLAIFLSSSFGYVTASVRRSWQINFSRMLFEILSKLLALLGSEQYTWVSAAAKEVGAVESFRTFNKLFSKFAHPTALS